MKDQWKAEIETRVNRHTLRVTCYYGAERETRAKQLSKYDVVITTYGLVKASAAKLVGFNHNSLIFTITNIN